MNATRFSGLWRALLCVLFAAVVAGCESRAVEKFVIIEADGKEMQRNTQAVTIGVALAEAQIKLGPLDRVSPDLNEPIERSARIVVTRVREELVTERRVIPFARQLLRDEAMDDGTSRVLQLGVNGREELITKIVYENGHELSRDLVAQHTIEIPREEIVVVGAKGLLQSVPISGTIFYLSNGNAWLMRDSSAAKRPITFSGDLDGRVFAIAPDTQRVLFSRRASVGGAVGAVGPLNSLWQLDTRFVGETATALGIENVLYAEWLSDSQIIYSSGERTGGAPGWKAHNDLWLYDLAARTKKQIVPPMSHMAYAFWGLTFALAPDRTRLLYASADELGFIELPLGKRSVLQQFPVYQTQSGWVWVPDLSWSPDMRLIVATLHAPPPETPRPELSPTFDVWAISVNGSFAVPLATESGMFASPLYSPQRRIAFAQAQHPQHSADSQYDLFVMDVDGSNKQRIFPLKGDHGFTNPQMAWSADGSELLVLYDGDLFLVSADGKRSVQLTANGGGSQPRWR